MRTPATSRLATRHRSRNGQLAGEVRRGSNPTRRHIRWTSNGLSGYSYTSAGRASALLSACAAYHSGSRGLTNMHSVFILMQADDCPILGARLLSFGHLRPTVPALSASGVRGMSFKPPSRAPEDELPPESPKAWSELHTRLLSWLRPRFPTHVLRAASPEDLVQATLLEAWAARRMFTKLKGSAQWAWIKITATRMMYRLLSLHRCDRTFRSRYLAHHEAEHAPAASMNSAAIEIPVEPQLLRLPARQCQVMRLIFLGGRSITFAAQILDLSPHAVEQALYKGRRNLRRLLSPLAPNEGQRPPRARVR